MKDKQPLNAVLLTRHQKATWIGPPLREAGFDVEEYNDFDTDSLGTFCNTKPRELDGKQTAAKKARLACELTNIRYGIGSEGSFSQHLVAGLTWEQEVLCLYDSETDTELFGFSEGPADVVTFDAEDEEDMCDVLGHFTPQKWMWQGRDGQWYKNLDMAKIQTLIGDNVASFPLSLVPDYRAMHCPSRQLLIEKAARDLAQRLREKCPRCKSSGFVYNETMHGLPCKSCSLPTQQPVGWWAVCHKCGYKDFLKAPSASADPQYCEFCNP